MNKIKFWQPQSDNYSLWETQTRETVMGVLEANNPTAAQIDLFGDSTTGKDMFIDGITKSGTTMDIGMFGYNNFYYFYMEF